MNLIGIQNKITMSSREIAQLTGKQHGHVKRDIENMAAELNLPKLDSSSFEHNGNIYTEYQLNKQLTLCLVSGYSALLRMKIINRLDEIEKNQFYIPQTYGEALQLCADQAKQLELAAPKVAFVDQLVERHSLMTSTQVAQKYKKSAVWLNKFLEEIGVFNRAIKRGRAFQQWFVEKGYGEMKQTESGHPQALFTPAGDVWINQKLYSESVI